MDFFNQTPEEISTLSLLLAISISNQYDLGKLAVITAFLSSLSSNLGLIAVERGIFERPADNSNTNSSSDVSDLEQRIADLEAIISGSKPTI
ncbi:hypothetical protein SAMN02745163_03209 [Clostridium cavendishii DSM 21758]|uniref:Uncharacterized protein n=1 Tax=Clostridium cavendishii DSM 21758 TaxID=1121302 RepID=A0A1M6PN70_9CLOT|nr:hypothetical protein SAMN02745163_03209 [Clostridium cavendishii DSM 21758]